MSQESVTEILIDTLSIPEEWRKKVWNSHFSVWQKRKMNKIYAIKQ